MYPSISFKCTLAPEVFFFPARRLRALGIEKKIQPRIRYGTFTGCLVYAHFKMADLCVFHYLRQPVSFKFTKHQTFKIKHCFTVLASAIGRKLCLNEYLVDYYLKMSRYTR